MDLFTDGCSGFMSEGRPAWLAPAGPGLWRLLVWACPGAGRTASDGEQAGFLRLRIAAQAVEGKANREACAWLAGRLGLKSRQVSLENGRSGRKKIFLLESKVEPDWRRIV